MAMHFFGDIKSSKMSNVEEDNMVMCCNQDGSMYRAALAARSIFMYVLRLSTNLEHFLSVFFFCIIVT
jgi:hypothetical protein